MFEKEAEEYQTEKRKTFNEHEQLCWGDVYKDWKSGAEFGYNKANEWHYVKDGDLPKDEDFKWCISDIGNPYVARWSEILNCWEGTMYQEVCCPYVWKEIVFPKELAE